MKKLFALVLALVMALIGTAPAVVADVATKTDTTYAIDLPQNVKDAIWLRGYKLRCRATKRLKGRGKRMLKRVLLAPLSLMLGVGVGDIVAMPIGKDRDVADAKARNERWAWLNADAEYIRQCEAEQAELDREAKAKAIEAAREIKKAAKAEEAKAKQAEKEAQKAKELAEQLEADKAFAKGFSVVKAINLVRQKDMVEGAIDANRDALAQARVRRDKLTAATKETAEAVKAIAAELKRPTSSSRYRKAVVAAEVAAAKLAEANAVVNQAAKALVETENLLGELNRQIRLIKKHGNPFAKEGLKCEIDKFARLAKVKMANEQKGVRPLQTIKERLKTDSFTLYSFDAQTVLAAYMGYIARLTEKTDYKKLLANVPTEERKSKVKELKQAAIIKKRKALKEFRAYLQNNERNPIVLKESTARVSRLRRSILSMIFGIDYDQKAPTTSWIVIEHGIQEMLKIDPKVFSDDDKKGQKELDELQLALYEHIGRRGVKVIGRPDEYGICSEITYDGLFSSASHQKGEKLVMADRRLMKLHQEALWFGRTKEQILNSSLTGAEIWKMRANMARPISMELTTKDGTPVYLHDGKMVPDAVRKYVHKKALRIGDSKNNGGKPYKFLDNAENEVVVGAGAILMLEEMNTSVAQLSGCGLKGCGVDARSSEAYALKKHKKDRPNWLNGVKILFSEDCWKFDKAGYASFDEYIRHMDELAERYPGINQVYVLRQGEEVEGEDKVRTLTRSLLQQLVAITKSEIAKLAMPAIAKLNKLNSLQGMFSIAAELNRDDEDRSPLAKLIIKIPGLLLEPAVQQIYEKKWKAIKIEAMGNKARTKGQYPYITQDPVALYEIWALGMSPNRNDLGVLRAGEVSLNLVKAGTKVVGVRFPANALTAKILVCRPLAGVFSSCGNVAILSIYDDILIVQDGDVDGDEMCILYDKLLVKLVERMRTIFQPPVIVFAHGDKAERKTIGTVEELIRRMYGSLWSAKRYDKVGLYANMARDCAYLLGAQVKRYQRACKTVDAAACSVNKAERAKARQSISILMLWMAACSTGAILAIDQVKGNSVDEGLIKWLDEVIKKNIDERMSVGDDENSKRCSPYTQPFVKGDASIESLEPNMDVGTDYFAVYVDEKTGEFRPDKTGTVRNEPAIVESMTGFEGYRTQVRRGFVTSGMLLELRYNYFNSLKKVNGENVDEKVFELIRRKQKVGLKELLELYWRNACSLQFRMANKTVPGKKKEYQKMVRDSIKDWALSSEWKVESDKATAPIGYIYTDSEKWSNVLREVLKMALEYDGDITKSSWTKFLLETFAEDFSENIDRIGTDVRDYLDGAYIDWIDEIEDCEATDFTALEESDQYDGYDDENIDLSEIDDGSMSLLGDDD